MRFSTVDRSHFLDYANVIDNPVNLVGLRRSLVSELAERILADEDVQRMLAAEAEPRDHVLLRLLYASGLRVSEACQLLWRNLHARGSAGQITVSARMA